MPGSPPEGCAPTASELSQLSKTIIPRRTLLAGAGVAAFLAAVGSETWFATSAEAAGYVQYQFPFPIRFYDSSDTYDNYRNHRGVDFNGAYAERWLNTGDQPAAVADGTVVGIGKISDCLGNGVVLQHDDGWYSGYFHLSVLPNLARGARVTRGQLLGNIGRDGTLACVTGVHLHLTIGANYNGAVGGGTHWIDHTDPIQFINARLSAQTPSTPLPLPKKDETDMLFMIFANDVNANPAVRYALVGPGFWLVVDSAAVANNLATRFGSNGAAANTTWAEWDRAYEAAVSSGFVPKAGQTSRTF